ncbi:hypothetical protein D9M71_248140 [compost metagenome]
MSLANTGSKAVAPPSNTANRSREMAPRISGRLRMKRMPAINESSVARPLFSGVCRAGRLSIRVQASTYRSTVGPYTQMLPKAYNRPPRAGATMVAACMADAEAATARGNRLVGTIPGNSAWVAGISKERALPSRKARTKIISRLTLSVLLPITKAEAINACAPWHNAATRRRS